MPSKSLKKLVIFRTSAGTSLLGFYGIIFGISQFARSAFSRSWGGG